MDNFNKIRPENLYEKILFQREHDSKKFLEELKKQGGEYIYCPACDSRKIEDFFKKWGYNHSLCRDCKTFYCNPRPNESLLSVYYNNYSAPKMWTKLLINSDLERKKIQLEPRVRKIMSYLEIKTTPMIAIDIGAGSGAFALTLKDENVFSDIIALDISDKCVEQCIKNGLNARKGTINDIPDQYADLITINDLIEHIANPCNLLEGCYKAMKQGGLLEIATPNGEGFDFKILKDKTSNITPPEHLNYFNPKSIEKLLRKAGFTEVHVETPGVLDVEIILHEIKKGYNLGEKNEYLSYIMNHGQAVRKSFQDFLIKNKLSSHMLAIAGKK